ncbi:MAG: CHASE2 domain-containing protein [Alphaproteobacteria bacterium]
MGTLIAGLRLIAVPAAIFLVVAAGSLAWRDARWVQSLEGQVLDALFQVRGVRAPRSETLILAIDDRSVAHFGGWPLERAMLADLVTTLDTVGAAAIGLDLLLLEGRYQDGELAAGDQALVAASAEADRLVLPFAVTPAQRGAPASSDDSIRSSAYLTYVQSPATAAEPATADGIDLLVPFPELSAVATVGHVSVPLEADGAVRRWSPVVGYADRRYPAMAVELARLYRNVDRADLLWVEGEGLWLGSRSIPTDQAGLLALNAYGPAGTFPTVSVVDFLTGRVPAHVARNRIVLIGATATGVGDSYITTFDRQMPGVELIATMTQNVLHGNTLIHNPATFGLSIVLLAVFTTAAALLGAIRLPNLLLVGIIGVLGLWGATLYAAFAWFDLWLDAAPALAAIPLTGVWVMGRRLVIDRRARVEAQARSSALSRFVAPALADRLAQRDSALTGFHECEAAVMFIDLVGFTQATEDLPAVQTLPLLSRFYRLVEAATDAHGGIVDKFIGDGAMALFGISSDTTERCASDGLLCALRLVSDVASQEPAGWTIGGRRLSISIGLHYGTVALAEIGGDRQVQFTATGDTVNVAARLEELTRELSTPLVVSNDTIEAARGLLPDAVLERFRSMPPRRLRGRRKPIAAWALRTEAPPIAVVA